MLACGARNAGAARLVGIIPSEAGDAGKVAGSIVGSGGSLPIPGMPPIGPNDGTAPAGCDGNPPIGPDGIPGIGPPIELGPGRPIGPPNAGDPALVG